MLSDGRSYILGETMSLADCVIYHPLWVMDQLASQRVGIIPDQIRTWMDRIVRRGHGTLTPMSASDALDVAAASEPRTFPSSEILEGDPRLGDAVSITPADYGRANPSIGTLVSIDAQQMALQHCNARTGSVCTHFPRFGYSVKPVTA